MTSSYGYYTLLPHFSHNCHPIYFRKQVFKRFYKLDVSRTSDTHYGLGLSIAHEILRLHGGRFSLTDSPHGGCAFKLLLPCLKP